MFASWLRRLTGPTRPLSGGRRGRREAPRGRPQLGRLEDRVTPATLLALNAAGTSLLRFDSATPGTVVTTPITGLAANETVQGIDFRPATGQLFGLGVGGSTGRLLTIHPGTGAATVVGTLSQLLGGTDFGFDFNPTNDRIRVTSDFDINYLVNPNDAVVTVQGTLNPGNPNVVGSAYTNNFPNATTTTLLAIDSNADQLFQQVPATGALSLVGNLGVDTTGSVGFDIAGNSNNPAFAALNVGGTSSLYTINTSTGAAILVGQIGPAGQVVRGLAVMRFTWDGAPDAGGASANANWTTATNWVGDVAPAAGDDLHFPAAAAQLTNANNLTAGTAFNSITFTGSGYTISGNGITLNAGVLDAAATGTNRLDTDITLAGTQTFSVTTAGHTLALGGVIGGAAGASFNKERIGATTANAGTLRLDGAASNTFAGVLSVNGGLLELAKTGGAVAVPSVLLVGDATGTDTARAVLGDQLANTANVVVNAGGLFDLNNNVDTIANLTLNAGQFTSGTGTLTTTGLTTVYGTAGDDAFVVAGTPAATTVSVNGVVSGTFVGGGFTINGQDGIDTLTGPDLANLWNLTGANAGNIGGVLAIPFSNVENLVGGTDADLFVFADAAGVTGTVNGGAGTDTLDYSAYTTVVAANLGLGAAGLGANLDADQEVGPNASTATATATLTYNVTAKTFDITVAVAGLAPADVIGFHIHRAPAGVNGPIIVDFVPGGVPIAPLVPTGDGFTFTAAGIPLAAFHEAALLGGLTYVNIHTAAFPGGIIRGQVFSTGNVNLSAVGTATGTGGIANVENATGGTGATTIGAATFGDSLVGSFGVNVLRGGDGNDVLVAGPGGDTMQGEGGNDVLVWSNGDGSDVMDGGAGSDTVNVNGNVTANDVFTVGAGAGGRVAFARVSPGPFTLDIGTAETLTVNGAAGNDTFSVNSLAGVTDLSAVNLHGFDGNDTFNVRSDAAVTINVLGHLPRTAPGDTLNFDPTGLAFTDTGTQFQQAGRQPVNYAQIEAVGSIGPVTVTGTGGDDTLVVTATGPDAGTYSLNGAAPVPFAGATVFSFDGGGGTDTLRINNPAGGLFAPAGGITFAGGGQAGDALENLGGAATAGTYSVGPGPGDGTLTHTGGGLTQTITFTGLAPVTDTVTEATFTVNATDAANAITVDNGAAAGDGLVRVAIDAFEPVEFANKTNVIVNGDLTAGGAGDQFVLSVTDAATGLATLTLNGLAGADTFQVVAGPVVIVDGGAGADTLTGPDAAATWTVTGADQGAIAGFVGSFLSVETLIGGSDADTFAFQPGGSVTGTITGGAGADTIDYSAFATPVAVNLGSTVPTLVASLDADQEAPANASTAAGTTTFTYDNVARTFGVNLTVTGINPADPGLRFHIHRAATGVNGPIIVSLFDAPAGTNAGTLTPTGPDSFTYTASNIPLPALDEAAFLGGLTYLNVHTTAFPGGEIRGQVFAGGLFVAAPGTATNTGGIAGIENATGGNSVGQFGDSLVGDLAANVLRGNLGNDVLVGSRGADTMEGGGAVGQLLGLAAGNNLVRFAADTLGPPLATVPVSGLIGGETVVGIDVRPANSQLYALTDQGRLYTVDPVTGAATLASTLSVALTGTTFGIDFNPVPDRLRIVSDADQNLRVNVATGDATIDGTLAYAAGDFNFGVDPNTVGVAYTNSVAGATTTTLYGIDANLDVLVTQNPPNLGLLNTVGQLGVDVSEVVGFDILPGTNTAFAALTVGGVTGLYTIDLSTGTATAVGTIGAATAVTGLTALPDNDVMVWSNGDGSDVIDGGAGADLVIVNGALGADDVFTVGAGAGGRVAFARTSPGPFTLDIGTAETLTVNGATGNDTFSVNSLVGVAGLTAVNLFGFDGNDTFNVTPDANASIFVAGHLPRTAPGDTLNLDLAGATSPTITAADNGTGFAGGFTFGDRQPVTFQQVETFAPAGSDLSITKTTGTTTVPPGGPVTYTITVTNNGPFDLTGVSVADTFPAALSGVTVSAVGFGGATGFTSLGTGNIADTVAMPAGSSITYTATGTLDLAATGTLDNTATVTGPATQTDPDPANNTAVESDPIEPEADLSVTKVDVADPVAPGATVTYTLTVSNAGLSPAAGVTLTDPLPTGTTFVSAAQTAGPAFTIVGPAVGAPGTVTATIGTLAAGGTATFRIVARVNPNTPPLTILTNTATVSSTTVDPVPGNNTVAENTNVQAATLPVVTGAGPGGGPHVKVFNPTTGALQASFFAYPGFQGGVRVAAGDVTGDGIADVVTGAGPGGGPHVKVFDGVSGAEVRSFFAFPGGFQGGVFVAAGDVNGDGLADVIVGAGPGGGPHVRAFSGANGSLLADFFAYDAAFQGGVTVAAGDLNGDGRADIVTGAGPGGGPHVKAFDVAGAATLQSFFAFGGGFGGGVFVAAGDLNGDNRADIIAGTGPGQANVRGFDGTTLAPLFNLSPYAGFFGGVRVGVADFNADGQLDLVTGAGPGGGPHVKVFNGQTQAELASFFAYDPGFLGGVFVG